jgi:signal transduction histidine kinase/CheY-like chemotaxis protein
MASIDVASVMTRHLEIASSVNYSDEAVRIARLVPLTAPLPIVDAFEARTPLFIGTAEELAAKYPEAVRAFPHLVLRAIACVPLVDHGSPLGAVVLAFPMPWTFGETEQARVRAFADECARAFAGTKRAAHEEAARAPIERATSHLERLHAFSGMLARSLTPPAVVDAIVEGALAASFASSCVLWLVSKDGKTVCPARSAGAVAAAGEQKSELPIDRSERVPILDAIRDGAPVWLESSRENAALYPDASRAHEGRSGDAVACVPMFAEGRCIGGLAFSWDGPRRFFEDERAFLQVLARNAAQAVERARLYAAEKRAKEIAEASRRRSDVLVQASALLGSSLDYTVTLHALLQALVPGFADWCTVEIEEEDKRGAPPLVAHVDPSKAAAVLELNLLYRKRTELENTLSVTMLSGKSLLYTDITMDRVRAGLPNAPELWALYESVGITATLVVPIAARGRVLGAMALNLSTTERRYDQDDLATAEALGQRIGIAIDNARLFRDAREADRKKDDFLAMLGHELRNPLAPIVTALDVMNARDTEAFAQERAVVSRHVRHLLRLVDDLLDVSRVTRGKIQLDRVRCSASDVLAEAIEMATPVIRERGHRLTTASTPEPPAIVMADHVRLAQAVANVLLNAAKYTEPGGEITASAVTDGPDAVIRVRDTGRGIPKETLPSIFDLFVQGDTSLDRANGGLGIGLTVVKSVVELHGGSVSAHSEGVGRGTEIAIRIPLAPSLPDAEVQHVVAPAFATGSTGAGLHVLVVDDNEDAAFMLQAALGLAGCTVSVVHDGEAALRAAASRAPDLVLLDIGLPDMDGYELARRLRSRVDPSVRFIAVTGYGQPSDRQRSKEAGFDEHVVKPVDLDALQGILERCRSTARA